ncbi:MAG: cytochrome P450 [Neolewinella sp.]
MGLLLQPSYSTISRETSALPSVRTHAALAVQMSAPVEFCKTLSVLTVPDTLKLNRSLASYNHRPIMHEPPKVPLARVLINMPWMMANPIKRFSRYLEEYGRDFILSVGGSRRTHFTINAEVIQHVLQKNHKNYHKSAIQTDELARYLGRGLLTNNGQPWLTQRRLIQPGFHRQRLAALVSEMQAVIDAACDGLNQTAEANGYIQLQEVTRDIVFRVITRAIFTDGFDEAETRKLKKTLDAIQRYAVYPVRMPFLLKPLQWLGIEGRKLALTQEVRKGIQERIDARRAGTPKDDLLQMLLDSRYEDDGQPMPDQQLVDEIIILFAAGHETSANALAWTIWLLLRHPEALAKVRAEITEVEGEGAINFDNARQLTYLTQVMEESMRLYPPAWITDRVALGPDKAGGFDIQQGTSIGIFFYGLHRNPEYWEDPDAFRPERMTPEAKKARQPFCFLPFGGGPRLCIGNHFAMLEMQLILARLLQDYDFELPANADQVKQKAYITLHMDRPVSLRLSRRPVASVVGK